MNWKAHSRSVLLALLVIHVLAHIDRNMLLGFAPQITGELHLSNAQYGFLTGAVWVLSFGIMAVVLGALADRHSRTRVMAVGIALWSLCTAASGAAQSFEQMAAARFFVASGEAALVPAAVSLLAELFSARRRGGAVGVFFMGIPLGIGLSFLLAGTLGASHGWRDTFWWLGVAGLAVAVPLWWLPDPRPLDEAHDPEISRGAPMRQQLPGVLRALRQRPTVVWVIAGFVLVHMAFAGLAFAQLWLVRERGFDAAGIARQIGALQLVMGAAGSLAGGLLGDRLARRLPGGHAGFMLALVLLCAPLMIAYRLSAPGGALFYLGMAAGFFLPLATYGPANAQIQGLMPPGMRSTTTGLTMLLINLLAIAVGNLAVGAVSDRLAAAGSAQPLSTVLLATDVAVALSALCFALATRGPRVSEEVSLSPAH